MQSTQHRCTVGVATVFVAIGMTAAGATPIMTATPAGTAIPTTRGARGTATVESGIDAAAASAVTPTQARLDVEPLLPPTLTRDGGSRTFDDAARRNVSGSASSAESRRAAPLTPHPGSLPDPFRKTFRVPPRPIDPAKRLLPGEVKMEPPGAWSPEQLFDMGSGYPYSVPSNPERLPDAWRALSPPPEPSPEQRFGDALRQRVGAD